MSASENTVHPTDAVWDGEAIVSGLVLQPLVLSAESLRCLAVGSLVDMRLVAREAGRAGTVSDVRGVRLRDVLDHAGIDRSDHNRLKKLAVVAASDDGYVAVFSWNELFNAEAGETVLVIFERDGQPLGAKEGPLALISGRDFWTGPRHVKALRSIELRQIVA